MATLKISTTTMIKLLPPHTQDVGPLIVFIFNCDLLFPYVVMQEAKLSFVSEPLAQLGQKMNKYRNLSRAQHCLKADQLQMSSLGKRTFRFLEVGKK